MFRSQSFLLCHGTQLQRLKSFACAVKPGVRYREVGEVISRHASLNGFSVVLIKSTFSLLCRTCTLFISFLFLGNLGLNSYFIVFKGHKAYALEEQAALR